MDITTAENSRMEIGGHGGCGREWIGGRPAPDLGLPGIKGLALFHFNSRLRYLNSKRQTDVTVTVRNIEVRLDGMNLASHCRSCPRQGCVPSVTRNGTRGHLPRSRPCRRHPNRVTDYASGADTDEDLVSGLGSNSGVSPLSVLSHDQTVEQLRRCHSASNAGWNT